jgi:hypothetical protein
VSDNTANAENAAQPETINKNELESLCRHLGRSLKGTGSSDASLAMHLMKEAEYLKTNGFENAHEMFALIAATLDPSLPIKMEHARRKD